MLDSNIVIKALGGEWPSLRERLASGYEDDFVISSITYAEVSHGSVHGKPPAPEVLDRFVRKVPVLSFDYKAALAYATLPFKRGRFDRLIAAHALSHDLIVVTDNERDFADVPGLRVENWTA